MKRLAFLLLVIIGLTGAACSTSPTPAASTPPVSAEVPLKTPTLLPTLVEKTISTPYPQPQLGETSLPVQPSQQLTLPETTLMDDQGAIIVEITPINSSTKPDSLNFSVGLTTHSIDLSMDLATLATLTTDNGSTVQATGWEAPRGGHHVSGMLSFPASVEGKLFLDGAKKLTLTIKDLDAPERIFTWDLP